MTCEIIVPNRFEAFLKIFHISSEIPIGVSGRMDMINDSGRYMNEINTSGVDGVLRRSSKGFWDGKMIDDSPTDRC